VKGAAGDAGKQVQISGVIGGNYSEVLNGLHKEVINVSGTFTLQRVSEDGTLIVN
jgi:hypothetical protein